MASSVGSGYNLLKFAPVRRLFLWAGFPYLFQAVFLVVFIGLAILGWSRFAPEGVPSKLYAKTNLVTLLIWGLWWPAMIWTAVLFGRAWCMICPLELVANGAERLARKLGLRQLILGRWLRAGALIVAFYALIQLLVAGIELHRIPAYSSIFLWTLLGLAAITGIVYKDRAICRGFCPVGVLLGTYGRGAMLVVRPGDEQSCADCTDKPCASQANRYLLDARSCPSLLNPAKLNTNADCLVCGQCFKSCEPDNMRLILQRPFHSINFCERFASWPVTVFVMLVSGFVTYELCSEWPVAQAAFLQVPGYLTEMAGNPALGGWFNGAWKLAIFPLGFWLVLGGLARISGAAGSLADAWRGLALPVAVVVSAGHMAKGLAKVSSWGGFLPGALQSHAGVETVVAINANLSPNPAHLLSLTVVSAIGLVLVLAGLFYSLKVVKQANSEESQGLFASIFITAVFYGFLVAGWGLF